jgi:hypothetical protein
MLKLLKMTLVLSVMLGVGGAYLQDGIPTSQEQMEPVAASIEDALAVAVQLMVSPTASEPHFVAPPKATATSTPTSSPTPTTTHTFTSTPSPTLTPTHTPTPTPIIYGPESFPPGINPLTGLQVDDPNLLNRRPIAVKIVNYPRYVRPQWGLAQADNIYEYYIEQGITRYIAIYYSQDVERVGPVRSGRYFDEHIFRMYQSYFVFACADDAVLDYFMEFERAIVNRFLVPRTHNTDPNCRYQEYRPLCRDLSIRNWNNLFVNTHLLNQFMLDRGSGNYNPDLSGMVFDERIPPNGSEATTVDLYYSQYIFNRWIYDSNLEQYLRYQDFQDDSESDGEVLAPLYDPVTNLPVLTDNIVILFVHHETVKENPEVVKIHLLNSGPAIVFRNGMAYYAYWARPQEGVLVIAHNAEYFPLKPGRTFFEVVGQTSEIISEDVHWRLEFSKP